MYAYSYVALGIALRYVLEALKQAPGKKMYMFGLTALDKFKTRSAVLNMYCMCVRMCTCVGKWCVVLLCNVNSCISWLNFCVILRVFLTG